MREFNKKNSEKLFLLKVCLPAAYEQIGNEGVEAVEKGWAKEQDFKFINDLVHKYVACDSETKERMVVYKPLYPREDGNYLFEYY